MSDLTPTESPFDAGRVPCPQGGEDRWSARWLMEQMGYPRWEDFERVIERAKIAAHNQGFNVQILFRVNPKKTGGRPQTDYLVTRFAAYLIAMNGDPRKVEVSAAQEYFVVKTREAETAQPQSVELTEDQILHRAMHILDGRVKALTAENQALTAVIERDAPKVAAYERFIDSDGTYALGVVAKLLGTSQNRLFRDLRARGVLISKGAMRNTPYQRYMHHFAVKSYEYDREDGSTGISYTTRVLPSGVPFIAKQIGRPLLEVVEP